ncbi:MAG TPA: ABC transporter ATP-binding protein [Pseudonocardiaceae bacterium]|nr:ABC transporter ATP-binding protein [Pseudonocardiaceae bacterium]
MTAQVKRAEGGPVLEVADLSVAVRTIDGELPIVTGVSFRVEAGQMLAIVGESGCGKSVLTRAIVGLLPREQWIVRGSARLDGVELVGQGPRAMRRVWGRDIGVVFQDSLTALNPVRTIGAQLTESIRRFREVNRATATEIARGALSSVGITDPAARLRAYPHQMSGGMRQRVCIAIALLGEPSLLIADEPTTGLDVTVQEQILDLLAARCQDENMASILVTHDLAVAATRADEVVVLYAGEVVESVASESLMSARMPYSRSLLAALPRLDDAIHSRLAAVPGQAPLPAEVGPGCRFVQRCPIRVDDCATHHPSFHADDGAGHGVRCWRTAEAATTAVQEQP